jgi:hypothetical protein
LSISIELTGFWLSFLRWHPDEGLIQVEPGKKKPALGGS